jgi:hypothetical protein
MLRKRAGVLGLIFGLSATVAMGWTYYLAYVTAASATVDCTGYKLKVTATNLPVGDYYKIPYDITVTCNGTPQSFTGTIEFQATSYTQTVSASGTWTLTGSCTVSGYVTGTQGTFPITINGSTEPVMLTCPLPTACVLPPSGTAISGAPVSWNGFTAPAGSVVWINAHIQSPSNVPTNTITKVYFTGVTLVVNSTTYALPDGQVVFNPSVSAPVTVANADGSWTTTVSPTTSGDIFFDGDAIPVDSNLENGGHGNTGSTLSFSTNSNDSSLDFQWQWGAAVYTSWPGNAAALIEPVQANGLQPGAPQNPAVQKDLIQGPRGGGGSNFTGSWSGTGKGTCP